MSIWVILIGKSTHLSNAETPHKIITSKEYLSAPGLFGKSRPKIINLASSYGYQTRGYYASLLAGARGHRVIPSVETMIDLSARPLYANAIPELEDMLNRCLGARAESAPTKLHIYFGSPPERRLERFGRLLFDWFGAPALEVTVRPGKWASIARIQLTPFHRITGDERCRFLAAMATYTGRNWSEAKPRVAAKYSVATLCDPSETLAPSSIASLKHWARIAARMGVDVEPISRRDLAKVANHDALFIRETTSISNHTYRFARRARQESMPVIDDPVSMIRCTNKVYLHELLGSAGIAMPRTVIASNTEECAAIADRIGFPMVVKIPDGSFSKGVKKVGNMTELTLLMREWLKETDLVICQEFMPTEFDWRIGVLGRKPLFVTQYLMARRHWQIVNHDSGRGTPIEGGFRSVSLAAAPPALIDMATSAASLIGDGLYGVDVKETRDGYFLIEVNDNPNLNHGCEDASEKDAVWTTLTQWFIDRIEA